jgi:uncharacterized membrane protein
MPAHDVGEWAFVVGATMLLVGWLLENGPRWRS